MVTLLGTLLKFFERVTGRAGSLTRDDVRPIAIRCLIEPIGVVRRVPMPIGERGHKAGGFGRFGVKFARVVKSQWQGCPPSTQRCRGILELHRNGEIAHAVDMGAREFAGANVDLDRR